MLLVYHNWGDLFSLKYNTMETQIKCLCTYEYMLPNVNKNYDVIIRYTYLLF